MTRLLAALAALLTLAACEPRQLSAPAARLDTGTPAPAEVRFRRADLPRGVSRSNLTLAEEFLDLTFRLEGGARIGGLLRHEGPVGVYVRSPELAPYRQDLADLLARLRREAGVAISEVRSPTSARLFVEAVPQRDLQRAQPGAACFIQPGVTSWAEFRNRPRGPFWSELRTLGRIAIFIPTDMVAQDVRACLNEEIAQALGPVNDLYRVADTVFNDDNRHTILTSFDMLMLRVLYDRDLRSGMSQTQVQLRLPGILSRLNPRGDGLGTLRRAPDNVAWKEQIQTALTQSNRPRERIAAANRAVAIARRMVPPDHREVVSLVTRARLEKDRNPSAARADFRRAFDLSRRQLGENDLRTAQIGFHVALSLVDEGQPRQALELVLRYKPVAVQMQEAVLYSSLLLVEARARDQLGERAAARRARLDHLRWARYAYGDADGSRARALAGLEAEAAEGTRERF